MGRERQMLFSWLFLFAELAYIAKADSPDNAET